MKALLKDCLRISLKELGQTHYDHGYLAEANQQFIKSHDMSINDDDIFKMDVLIAKCGY